MTFPSDTYIDLCTKPEVAEKLREEWGPKVGDWCVLLNGWGQKGVALLLSTFVGGKIHLYDRFGEHEFIWRPDQLTKECTWLPTQRQLIAMIEERGYDWLLEVGALRDKDERYEAVLYGLCTKSTTAVKIRVGGPDPETALLKCLLEVMNESD